MMPTESQEKTIWTKYIWTNHTKQCCQKKKKKKIPAILRGKHSHFHMLMSQFPFFFSFIIRFWQHGPRSRFLTQGRQEQITRLFHTIHMALLPFVECIFWRSLHWRHWTCLCSVLASESLWVHSPLYHSYPSKPSDTINHWWYFAVEEPISPTFWASWKQLTTSFYYLVPPVKPPASARIPNTLQVETCIRFCYLPCLFLGEGSLNHGFIVPWSDATLIWPFLTSTWEKLTWTLKSILSSLRWHHSYRKEQCRLALRCHSHSSVVTDMTSDLLGNFICHWFFLLHLVLLP